MLKIIQAINDVTWGWLLSIILLAFGVFILIRNRAPQFRFFGKMWKNIATSTKAAEENGVSGFGVLCSALGSLIGTGTLVGTATAVMSGGPGAVFWMWIVCLLAMGISFGETILAQISRDKDTEGTYCGGAPYYIAKLLKQPKLGVVYSVCMFVTIGFCYMMLQSNSISQAVSGVVDVNPWIVGVIVMILSFAVVIGGLKRLTSITSYIVPFMAGAYIVCALIVIIANYKNIPAVFASIFTSAFTGKAAAGGIAGYSIQQAFRYGVARGMFSNDCGTGCTGSLNAGAEVKHPVEQGLAAMVGIFIVTTIICTITALSILLTGAMATGDVGIQLTQAAFESVLGKTGRWIITIAMFLFAYTSLIADVYLGEVNLNYLAKKNKNVKIWIYRVAAAIMCVVGAVISLDSMWALIDFTIAFMIVINLYALFRLNGQVRYVIKDYDTQIKNGVERPVWDFDRDLSVLPDQEENE